MAPLFKLLRPLSVGGAEWGPSHRFEVLKKVSFSAGGIPGRNLCFLVYSILDPTKRVGTWPRGDCNV